MEKKSYGDEGINNSEGGLMRGSRQEEEPRIEGRRVTRIIQNDIFGRLVFEKSKIQAQNSNFKLLQGISKLIYPRRQFE